MLISKADYDSIVETNYLFSNPVNARQLLDSFDAARRGEVQEHELIEP